jgi:cell division control protein 6
LTLDEPIYLSFAPYKVEEISAIIKNRLEGLEPGTPITPATAGMLNGLEGTPSKKASNLLMQPNAIELTARKLAGTGDLRKALDVCRYMVGLT